MRSRIGFIGIRQAGIPGSRENTGNFLHGYAARHIVNECIDISPVPQTDEDFDLLRQQITHIGVVAATDVPLIGPSKFASQHKIMVHIIERARLPVVVFGLGVAQAPLGAALKEANVHENTIRFLKVLSEHTGKIAVRGPFTAELLNSVGIRNVEVVGCQSVFLSCTPDFRFPDVSSNIADTPWQKTIVSMTRFPQELRLIGEAMQGGATHIGQRGHFEYELQRIQPGIALNELPESVLALMSKGYQNCFARGKIDFQSYHRWTSTHFRQFYSMPEWFNFLRGNFDLAVGTRFHGNMTAMHAGIPALWVVHDSRTDEFCKLLSLPSIQLEKMKMSKTPIRELIAEHLDPSRFNAVYRENYRRFHTWLEGEGVSHRLALPG